MDLAIKIAGFAVSILVLFFGSVKLFDKKIEKLNAKIASNNVQIAKLKTIVDMLEKNMWKQNDLEDLIEKVAIRTVGIAVDKFKIEQLKMGIGADKRESDITDT